MADSKPRTRVSQACKICGFKKIKCGGELPRCKTCVLHNRECSYGVSKRNTRLNLMRPLLVQQSIDGVPNPSNDASAGGFSGSTNKPVSHHVSVTPEESARLFQTYFTCIHPIWPLLYKPLYNFLGYQQLAAHLPKAVVYSIYAIAACLPSSLEESAGSDVSATGENDSEPARPTKRKPSEFFDAALTELQCDAVNVTEPPRMINLLKPSIPHCQALTILALQQHGLAEFSRSGVLCGLAVSMATDLRLHRNHWAADPSEKEVCSRLWWNIYILEKMMNFEMGKPVTLRSEETDTPYPSIAESDEFELFTPMTANKTLSEQPPPVKMRTLSAFVTTIDMCKIMERISREVYSLGAREAIRQDRIAGDKLRTLLWQDLQEWKQSVENTPLKLDLSRKNVTLPALITNYVTIESATILLHRPYIAHWSQCLEQNGYPPFDTPDPSQICYQSAKEICIILEAYSGYLIQMPCDLIFPIFTAASTLLHNLRQNSTPESQDTRRQLRQCLYWLTIFGKNWKSAGERQKLFNDLYEWPQQQQPNAPKEPYQTILPEILPGLSNHPVSQTLPQSVVQPDDGGFADILANVNDWGFLDVFGDSADTFYAMNTEFRNVLEGQNEGFIGIQ